MAETPQVNHSQVLDDLTSLQQDTPKTSTEARADSQISSPESGRPDSPSLYNTDTRPNNNQNDLTSQRKESELTTSEISSNPRRAENNYRENLSGDPGQLQSNPQDQFTVSNQNIQETRNPIEATGVRQNNPGISLTTNGTGQVDRGGESQTEISSQSETVTNQQIETTQPVANEVIPTQITPIQTPQTPTLITDPTPTTPIIDPPDDGQKIIPNVTVDIEVDPGSKLLKGTWSYADTVTVTVTGSDGSERKFEAIINPNGTWTVDVGGIEFSEDIIYTAIATATNDAGSATAIDSDSYDVPPPPPPPPPVEVSRETVNEVTTKVTVGDPRTEATFVDNEFCRADTENNKTIETTIRTWTDTTITTTTVTQTSTPVTTITYSDGTTEIIRGESITTQEIKNDVTTNTREEVISTDIEDPIIEVVWNETIESVTGDPRNSTEFTSENTVRTKDDENNRWVDTTTKTYKDRTETDTTTTTNRTPTYTITYCDGTVETEIGNPVITTNITTNVIESLREIVTVNYEDYPVVEVSRITVDEIVTDTLVSEPVTVTTYTDSEFCRADTENNKTIETTVRNYTDTTTITTTVTKNITPVTTITYSNGTTETIRGELTVTQEITNDISTSTREEVISTDIEEPMIGVVWNETVSSVTNPPTKTTQLVSENTVRTEDDENDRWVDTTTKTYKDTITTDTITTTTRTPTYTITYCDGTVETEIGSSITTTATSTTVETITYSDVTNITYEPYPEKEHQDNGWGNGDDTPPGNSGDNNNAENNDSGKTDPTDNNNGNPKDDTATDGQNPGNDKPVGESPWDGETGDSGNPGNGNPQDGIDNDTNNPPGNPSGNNPSDPGQENKPEEPPIVNPDPEPNTDGQNPGNDKPVGESPWDGETGDSGNPGNGQPQDTIDNNTNNPPGNPDGTNDTINNSPTIDPFLELEFNLDKFLPNGNKITESNLSDWVRLVEESDGSALLQVDKHEGKKGASSGWTDVIDIPDAAGKEAFFDPQTQTVDFVNDAGDWQVHHEHTAV